MQLIHENNSENEFYIENYSDNIVKLCCSCLKKDEKMPSHCESNKFYLEPKNSQNIIFRFPKEGNLNTNENLYFEQTKDKRRKYTTIGRRKDLKDIYGIFDGEKLDGMHVVIIHGKMKVGKQDYAEYTCSYLFERKVIKYYELIEVKNSSYAYHKIMNIMNERKKNTGKNVIIVKIDYTLEKPLDVLNEIVSQNNIFQHHFYYFI